MAVGDLIQFTVNTTVNSSPMQNVLYYHVAGDDTVIPNIEALLAQFNVSVTSAWRDAISAQATIECYVAQKVFPAPVERSSDLSIGLIGIIGGDPLPATTTGLIRKTNPLVSGKGKSGRFYLSGMAESQQFGGRILNSQKAPLESLAAVLQLSLLSTGGGDYQPAWAVKSPVSPFPITGFVLAEKFELLPRLANQRRRRTPIQSFN